MSGETLRLTDAPADLRRAAELLRAGELVAIPTETVYGLAADALNGRAVRKIFEAKGRPMDNPLIVHIADISDWAALVTHIPEKARALAAAYWPGPLTMILPHAPCIPDEVSAGLATVAVRFPAHPVARDLIRLTGGPSRPRRPTAPASRALRPPPMCWRTWRGGSPRWWTAAPAPWGWNPRWWIFRAKRPGCFAPAGSRWRCWRLSRGRWTWTGGDPRPAGRGRGRLPRHEI